MNGGAEVEAEGYNIRLKIWGVDFDEFVVLDTIRARALALSTIQLVNEIEGRQEQRDG